MTTVDEYGALDAALANGFRLLAGHPASAAEQANEILSKDAENRPALRLLGFALRRLGRDDEASQAELDAIKAASNEFDLVRCAQAIHAGDLKSAEHVVRPYLERHPDDPAGLRLLAEIAVKVGHFEQAEKLLRRALELAPKYVSAQLKLANALFGQGKFPAAIEALDGLLALEPEHGRARGSKAATLVRVGEYEEALALYEQLIERGPRNPDLWISYGHILNTVGRFDDSVAAYRKAIEVQPVQGEAWFYLSNLKTARFSEGDVAAMTATLNEDETGDKERLQLHFALGKAFEDAGDYRQAFEHYEAGNRIRDKELGYDPAVTHEFVLKCEEAFTSDFFRERAQAGALNPAPIFIVGMPRAGSTLLEQILSSHSQIEGTSELPYMPALRHGLSEGEKSFPQSLASLSAPQLRELGESYLAKARANRKTDRPYFIDKLPNNWQHVGLILAILPNAHIIDARRHPMACCFSNYKQHFAQGQAYTYSLASVGRYYADYVRLMAHFDRILPGRVHRIIHERLLDNPEEEIRQALAYLGVEFEESCLRFYENERPVRTPSAEQVRKPLNRKGVEQWRHFEPWLGELKSALGPVLDEYPDVPEAFED